MKSSFKHLFIRLIAGILGGVMMLSFTACGGKEEQSSAPVAQTVYTIAQKDQCPIHPNGLFTDNAVLQRQRNVPIWGTVDEALEGKEIAVRFGEQCKKTTVKDGAWRVDLDPMEASNENRTLTVSCEDTALEIHNVRVGEVFLASGQSNMVFYIEYLPDNECKQSILDDCNRPDMGFFVVPEVESNHEQDDVEGSWVVPSRANITQSKISIVAFLAAREVQKELNIPVAVIICAFGGTKIETWIPPKVLIQAQREEDLKLCYAVTGKCCYNGMMHALEPYAFRTMLFYQGEANSIPYEYTDYYVDYLDLMLKTIRERFENPDLSYVQVQLPSYEDEIFNYSLLRAVQQSCDDKVKNCYTTINYDTGLPVADLHPQDKLQVGIRMGNMVLEKVFGVARDNNYPKAVSAEATEDGVLVTFETGEDGLAVEDTATIFSLEVAGADGTYYPATGVLVGKNRLEVVCPQVRTPKKVRYGYRASMVQGCNFFGKNGLPVKPFLLDVQVNI